MRKVWRGPRPAWCCRCLSWPGYSPSQICALKDLALPGAWSGQRGILKAKNRMTTFSSPFFPCCSWNVANYIFYYHYHSASYFNTCYFGDLRYILCLEEMCIGAVCFILSQFWKFLLECFPLLDIFWDLFDERHDIRIFNPGCVAWSNWMQSPGNIFYWQGRTKE